MDLADLSFDKYVYLSMKNRKKILAISGSTRSKSTNESVLQVIAAWYADVLDVRVYQGIANLPHFNPDIADDALPAAVKEFRTLVDQADGVIICTPEYVFSLPGSLKNAIEWTVSTTVFSHKPVALIVASASGEKAFEALKLIMSTIEAKISDDASLLIQGAKGKFDKDGKAIDEQVQESLKKVTDGLIAMIKQTRKEMLESYNG